MPTIGQSSSESAAWRFIRIGPRRQALVIEAVASLAAARIMLAIYPFSRVARRLGTFDVPSPSETRREPAQTRDAEVAREIRWAVRVAARRMPFRALCLQQAIAAHAMLRRRRVESVLHLGASAGDTPSLSAHAWLEAAGARVTGYPIQPDIVEVGRFV